jgi:glycolate oxidase
MKADMEIIRGQLREILGPSRFLSEPEDLAAYGYDASGLKFLPWGAAFPETAEEVAAVMRLAHREEFIVIPRGSGTGMSGGSLPVKSGLVLVLNRMNKVVRINEEDMTADVQPGVITGQFQKQVERLGLFYPPDPASLNVCTIGGNVAEGAGGPRAVKYGVTRDYVLGLQAVLPTGEIIKTGVRTAKGVVGYDLTRLLVGSEGTLAVVTEITLRLIPLPPHRKTLSVAFPTLEDAARTIRDIMSSRIVPSVLEFMDDASMRCVEAKLGLDLYRDSKALIFAEVDGHAQDVEYQCTKISEIASKHHASKFLTASNKAEEEDMWRFRRSISPALFTYAPHKINEDIVVPRSRIPEMVAFVETLQREEGLLITTFGHAGDGNIHVNLMLDKRDPEQARRARVILDRLFREVVRRGGTLSGEHGVGITKSPFVGLELGELGIDVMKRIKRSFDPKGILNPGKIFPDLPTDQGVDRIFTAV